MENNENKGFSIWYILGHLFMVCILSSVAIYYIYKGDNASTSDYISGAGSVASVYAILLALWQISRHTSMYVPRKTAIVSVQALIENNDIKAKKLMDQLTVYPPKHFFYVSTDKAANPVNIMGAS